MFGVRAFVVAARSCRTPAALYSLADTAPRSKSRRPTCVQLVMQLCRLDGVRAARPLPAARALRQLATARLVVRRHMRHGERDQQHPRCVARAVRARAGHAPVDRCALASGMASTAGADADTALAGAITTRSSRSGRCTVRPRSGMPSSCARGVTRERRRARRETLARRSQARHSSLSLSPLTSPLRRGSMWG